MPIANIIGLEGLGLIKREHGKRFVDETPTNDKDKFTVNIFGCIIDKQQSSFANAFPISHVLFAPEQF